MNNIKSDGWVLSNKAGKLFPWSFHTEKDQAWAKSFSYLYKYKWAKPYYKRWNDSIEAANKRGWKLVECRIQII